MAKRKRKKDTRLQSANALRQNGMQAFKRQDYAGAIITWERAYKQQASPQTAVALAEAYFRRGMQGQQQKLDASATLADLERAVQLQPDDACYTYHLALALHRRGQTAVALPLYHKVRQHKNTYARRAAYPLALALLQQGDNPANHPVWADLSADEQTMLRFGGSLKQADEDEATRPPFWQGIQALRNGRYPDAVPYLKQSLDAPINLWQQAIAHYALGLVSAQTPDWDATRHHWQTAVNNGLKQPFLQNNLAELFHRLAEERLLADDLDGADNAARQAAQFYSERPSTFTELQAQLDQRQGYYAAAANQWEKAFTHWQRARDLDGGNFRLAYNLALALEKQEEFVAAGAAWREALRRRPRRSDHPDAINDEQVSRLWQRAAAAYQKAGDFEEAVQVYRHAVKWNENDLEIRLALATSLMMNGQLRAAENELERILTKDPNHVPALIQLGEAFAAEEQWYHNMRAPQVWQRALQIEPQNQQARHLLADFYVNQAEAALSWDEVERAIENYERARQYMPQDMVTLAALGSCYLFSGDTATAAKHIDEAIAGDPTNLHVYEPVLKAWLALGKQEEVERVLAQMVTAVPHIPYEFFMSLAVHCLTEDLPDFVQPWLERAIAAAPPSANIQLRIGELLMVIGDPDMARHYLEKAISANQEPGSAYLALGMVAIRIGDHKLAEQHWRQAEKLARKQKDEELLARLRETRMMFGGPLGSLFSILGGKGSLPNLMQLMPGFMDEDWDDEDWDDEEWDDEF